MQAVDLKDLAIGDFVEFVDIHPRAETFAQSQDPAYWFVVQTEPQQDLTTVWRLHEVKDAQSQNLELYVPVIRRRVKTGRIGRNGQKVTRIVAKPMFPGYGFLRDTGVPIGTVLATRGVSGLMKTVDDKFVKLPHQAVIAVFKKQMQEHQEWLQTVGARRGAKWKKGDMVRVDSEGGVYAGLVASVDKIDRKGRIELLFGMIRHTLPADMVVAA